MLQSDGFGPAYRDLARREPVFARLVTVYGRPDPFEWHDGGRTGSCCTLWDSRYQPSQRSRSTTGLARPPAAFPRRPAFSASARTASGPAGCLRPGHATPWLSPKLVDLPQGQPGHPSRAMTEEQASKVLKAAGGQATGFVKVVKVSQGKYAATHAATESGELACGTWTRLGTPATEIGTDLATTTCRFCRAELGLDVDADENQRLEALFVLSITLGLRPGELRKLAWDHVDLDNAVIHVWQSASRTGDVKTPKSKRSLVLPKRAVTALQAHRKRQAAERLAAGAAWQDNNLVFCHEDGRMYTSDALNWRFGKMTRRAGIGHWHAHEGRHTAVSIMSSNGVPLQEISDTVGHKSTHVTETVYRHVIVPSIRGGATVMDAVFGEDESKRYGQRDTATNGPNPDA